VGKLSLISDGGGGNETIVADDSEDVTIVV
jgi:hypothetical protein